MYSLSMINYHLQIPPTLNISSFLIYITLKYWMANNWFQFKWNNEHIIQTMFIQQSTIICVNFELQMWVKNERLLFLPIMLFLFIPRGIFITNKGRFFVVIKTYTAADPFVLLLFKPEPPTSFYYAIQPALVQP